MVNLPILTKESNIIKSNLSTCLYYTYSTSFRRYTSLSIQPWNISFWLVLRMPCWKL